MNYVLKRNLNIIRKYSIENKCPIGHILLLKYTTVLLL